MPSKKHHPEASAKGDASAKSIVNDNDKDNDNDNDTNDRDDENEDFEEEEENEEDKNEMQHRLRNHLRRNRIGMGGKMGVKHNNNDDPFAKVKFTIPPFSRAYDAEAYLDWEMTIEQNFNPI
jgi:hypothetical protein